MSETNAEYPHRCKGCGHPMKVPGWCWVCRNPERPAAIGEARQ